jgi:hypothetical protein
MNAPMRLVLVVSLLAALAARADAGEPPTPGDPDADAVVDAAPAGEDLELDSDAGRARYQRERLTLVTGTHTAQARRGDATLSGAELYLALDRPDLAERYRSGQHERLFVGAVGLALVGVGLYLPFIPGDDCSVYDNRRPCEDANADADAFHLTVGVSSVVLGAGIVAAAWWWFDPDPVGRATVDRLVERKNWKLRRRLGVVDLALVPTVGAGTGGLVLAGAF